MCAYLTIVHLKFSALGNLLLHQLFCIHQFLMLIGHDHWQLRSLGKIKPSITYHTESIQIYVSWLLCYVAVYPSTAIIVLSTCKPEHSVRHSVSNSVIKGSRWKMFLRSWSLMSALTLPVTTCKCGMVMCLVASVCLSVYVCLCLSCSCSNF